jgi:hypothetical protein
LPRRHEAQSESSAREQYRTRAPSKECKCSVTKLREGKEVSQRLLFRYELTVRRMLSEFYRKGGQAKTQDRNIEQGTPNKEFRSLSTSDFDKQFLSWESQMKCHKVAPRTKKSHKDFLV